MIPGMAVHLSNLMAQEKVAVAKRKTESIRNLQPGRSLRVTMKERQEYLLQWGNEISFMYGMGYYYKWTNLGSGIWEVRLVEAK